ncbi:MAG: glycoside hydrolase family 88 protein [Oceanipulchritudo sp.]
MHCLAAEEALRLPARGLAAAEVGACLNGPRPTGPFNALDFAMYRETRDTAWLRAFESSATAILNQPRRSPEGAWLHPCGNHLQGRLAILIDSFQEEASRLIKLAWLIRAGEPVPARLDPDELEETACRQFEIHRDILRDPATGLWHNGRGWIADDPARLSPGAWSRGHGWLLRGLMECLDHLGHPVRRQRLAGILNEVAEALMNHRPPSGIWHALLNETPDRSPPESSGSALIAAALIRAGQMDGLIPGIDPTPVMESASVLMEDHLSADGIVLHACPGPGPLASDAGYRVPSHFKPGDPHGTAAFCALAAAFPAAGNKIFHRVVVPAP